VNFPSIDALYWCGNASVCTFSAVIARQLRFSGTKSLVDLSAVFIFFEFNFTPLWLIVNKKSLTAAFYVTDKFIYLSGMLCALYALCASCSLSLMTSSLRLRRKN